MPLNTPSDLQSKCATSSFSTSPEPTIFSPRLAVWSIANNQKDILSPPTTNPPTSKEGRSSCSHLSTSVLQVGGSSAAYSDNIFFVPNLPAAFAIPQEN